MMCNFNHFIRWYRRASKIKINIRQKDSFIRPKRAINKILFSRCINKPREVRGRLPQHLKHLILPQSTKTWDPFWDTSQPLINLKALSLSSVLPLEKIKQNVVILYQTGGRAAGWAAERGALERAERGRGGRGGEGGAWIKQQQQQ